MSLTADCSMNSNTCNVSDIKNAGLESKAIGKRRTKTKIVCMLGPAFRSVEIFEKLLRAGMNVACFNYEYHQETLDNLHTAMENTVRILCDVMLDTKCPEIRSGFLKDGHPIQLEEGPQITVTTDYTQGVKVVPLISMALRMPKK